MNACSEHGSSLAWEAAPQLILKMAPVPLLLQALESFQLLFSVRFRAFECERVNRRISKSCIPSLLAMLSSKEDTTGWLAGNLLGVPGSLDAPTLSILLRVERYKEGRYGDEGR